MIISRADLINDVAQTTELRKIDTEKVLDTLFDRIRQGLASGDEIRIWGFGTLSVLARPAREGRNPRTGEAIAIAAKKTPKFTPAKALKDAMNAPSRKVGGDRNSPMRRTG